LLTSTRWRRHTAASQQDRAYIGGFEAPEARSALEGWDQRRAAPHDLGLDGVLNRVGLHDKFGFKDDAYLRLTN
jgi:hypothetical protein